MTARDELQQWVSGYSQYGADRSFTFPVDLARRVLAEMDEAKDVNRLVMSTLDRALTAVCEIAEVPDDIDDPDVPFEKLARIKAERDASLATLDAVRAHRRFHYTYADDVQVVVASELDALLDRGQA